MDRHEIAARLKSVRETAKLTQAEMAAEVGAALTTYKQWEHARYDLPAAVYFALERSRNINPSWLYNGSGPVHGNNRPARPIDEDQAEGIASKVYRQFSDRLRLPEDQMLVVIDAIAAGALRGADRAVANAPA